MPKGPGAAKSGAGTVWVDVRGDTSGLTKDIAASAKTAGGAVASSLGSGARTVLGDLGKAAGVAAVAAGGIAAAAIKTSADFNQAMSGVGAVANASAADLAKLRESALEAGAATAFSASEAADAQAELVKAGVSVSDVLGGGLIGSLGLAAAGQLDLADAATISAQAMNVFKLGGKDVGHIADVLAAGANKSAADVKQLGDALRQGGLMAAQTGLSLEETTGVLSLFADRALIGSDAGTSLKTMLQRLVPSGAPAANMMKELGLKFFDAQGAFVGIDQVAQQLQTSLKGLSDEQRTQALTTIFGSDAVRAASILMDGGAKSVREYTDAVNDQGAATRMAAAQLDNLKGDIEEFSGSTETALIRLGDLADGSLRAVVQDATALVNVFNDFAGTPAFAAIGDNIGRIAAKADVAGKVSERLHKALDGISESDVNRFFARFEGDLGRARRSMEGLEGVAAGLGVSFASMALRSIPLIGGLVPAFAPISGVLGGLVLGSKEGRAALESLGKQAATLARKEGPELLRSLSGLADVASKAVAGALESVGTAGLEAAEVLGPVLADAIDELGPPLADLIEAGGELVGEVLPDLADLAGVVIPPAVDLMAAGVTVAADALKFLADHSEIALAALGGLAGFKISTGLLNLGSTVASASASLKVVASDFATFYQVLRAEGSSIGGALSGAARETGGLVGAVASLNPAVVGVTAAVAAGAFIWGAYAKKQKEVKEVSDDLAAILGQEAETFEQALRKNYLDELGESLPLINELSLSVSELGTLAVENGDEFRQMGRDLAKAVRDPLTGETIPAEEALKRFRWTLKDLPEEVASVGNAIADLVAHGDLSMPEASKFFESLQRIGEGTVDQIRDSREEFQAMAQDAWTAGRISEDAFTRISKAINEANTPEEMNAAIFELLGLLGETGSAAETTADQIQKAVEAIRSLRDELSGLADVDRDVDASQRSLADAMQRTSEGFAKGGGISLYTEQGRRNADNIARQVDEAEKLAAAQAKLDPTGQAATATLQGQADALVKLRDEGSLTAAEFQHLIDLYDLTPDEIRTTVLADIGDAQADLDKLRNQINDLPGVSEDAKAKLVAELDAGNVAAVEAELDRLARDRRVQIIADATARWAAGGKVSFGELLGIDGARAAGGPVAPGSYLIGENGPEILDIGSSGYVFNNADTKQILGDKSLPGNEFMLSELQGLRADFAALADAMAVIATRPQAAPEVNINASAGVDVSAETKLRRAAR